MNVCFVFCLPLPSYLLGYVVLFSLKEKLSKMTVSADHVIKVVPHRIYSMAVHPCESNTLVAAGSKWGHLGKSNKIASEPL